MTALLSQNLARAGVARLWTIADVALLPRILAQGDVDYELHDGRIIILAPAGDMHSSSQTNLIFELVLQGQRKGLGVTRTEPGIILRRDPDHMLVPGVALMPTASLPLQLSPEGYLETIPQLVVEVRSPNDSTPEVERKVSEYLAAGVVVVWVPDPARRILTEYRTGVPANIYQAEDVLTVADIIPGFRAIVANLF